MLLRVLQEESEEKKQKRMEKEVRNMKNKIRHLKEKQDQMKRERMGYKMALKNQQAALKSVAFLGFILVVKKAVDYRHVAINFFNSLKA